VTVSVKVGFRYMKKDTFCISTYIILLMLLLILLHYRYYSTKTTFPLFYTYVLTFSFYYPVASNKGCVSLTFPFASNLELVFSITFSPVPSIEFNNFV